MSITSIDKEYVAGTYGRFPVELVSGKGSILTAADGREYIDLGSGIGVTGPTSRSSTGMTAAWKACAAPHCARLRGTTAA